MHILFIKIEMRINKKKIPHTLLYYDLSCMSVDREHGIENITATKQQVQ